MLVFSSLLLPVSAVAEPNELTPGTETQATVLDDLEDDSLIDYEEDDIEEYVFPEDAPLPYETQSDDSFFSFLDTPQQYIGSGVDSLGKSFDEFFSEDKVFYESSGTYLQLTGDTTRDNNGDVHSKWSFRLKLRLPHTSEKIKLNIQTEKDRRNEGRLDQPEIATTQTADDDKYSATFQSTIGKKKEEGWEFKPGIGMRLSSDVNIHFKLRANRKFKLGSWSANWLESAYWYRLTGSELDSILEFDRKITEKDLFRATTYARWTHTNQYFDLNQSFAMFHTLSKRRAISYFVGAYGTSEPTTHITHYATGAAYRQMLHKDYLFIEVVPQLSYPKENNFHSEFSLLVRIEMIFKK